MMSEQLPLAEVKNHFSEVVERLEREHGRVVITKHGHPAAVMLSVEDLESLEETLQVLSNSRLLAEIRDAHKDLEAAGTTRLDKHEALALIKGR